MLGVHSLAPAKLYAGTERKPAPKPISKMGDVQSAVSGDATAMTDSHGSDFTHTQKKELAGGPDDTTRLAQRDSGVGSTTDESHEFSRTTEDEPITLQNTEPASWLAGEQPAVSDSTQEPTTISPPQPPMAPAENSENRTDSIDFSNRPPTEAGPSQKRAGSSHSSLQHDAPLEQGPPRPDETHFNAIAYRRDPETVIAYLVPLPEPRLQGTKTATEPKYFLYAPPPPHLLKPRNGASEGYVRKLNRHWQQQVRRAQRSEQPAGKRPLPHKRLHGKVVRGMTRALGKLQTDDVTFLARIHPTTVNHLILIHPWALSGAQNPEEVMRTFRAQMFESKKKAKRDSILSAVFFMPALAIDTLAIFFGGMAEVDGIWMLVSVTAYRTARFITRKMGPEPKTMELEQAKLIEDAKRSGFPPTPPPEVEEDSEPGAVRRSVDALRRSLGSVKYRMSVNQRRSRSRKRKGGESSSTDTSRPQTTEASGTDLEGFNGGELEDHAEENEAPPTTTAEVPAAAPPSTAHSGSELSGFLEHMDEEIEDDGQPGSSSGGVFASDIDGNRTSAESNNTSKSTKKKGQNFQLTFYPSPAMDVLARYVQESCHMKNGRAYASPDVVPTEEDVLAVLGWHPERREHNSPEEQADDQAWQTQAIKNDLRQASRKAAKAWNKSCRKQVKKQRRSKKRGLLAFRRPAKKASKGKTKEATTSTDSEPTSSSAEKEARSAAIKARIAALRAKVQRKQQKPAAAAAVGDEVQTESAVDTTTPASAQEEEATTTKKDKRGRAAGAAAILGAPCFALAERVKNRRRKQASRKTSEPSSDSPAPSSEKKKKEGGARRGGALKQRMVSKRDALRQRKTKKDAGVADNDSQTTPPPVAPVGLETPTDIDEAPRDTDEGQTTTAATDSDHQTEVGDNDAKKDKSLKGKVLAIPAGIAAAIGAVLKKRRNGKDGNKKKKTTTTAADNLSEEPREKKASRFSALQERFKARLSRVSKKKKSSSSPSSTPTAKKQSRISGVKEWIQELKQKRRLKKAANKSNKEATKAATPAQEEEGNQPKSTKEHGAVVGLVAGCVALPMAKAKQMRDKRRKTGQQQQPASIHTDSATVVSGTQLSPVPEEIPAHQQQRTTATTNDDVTTTTTTTQAPPAYTDAAAAASTVARPTTSYRSPIVDDEEDDEEELFEDPPEELPTTDTHSHQYLPGLGQSEVPVRPGPPDATLGSSETAVEQITSSANEPRQSIEPASAAGAAGVGGRLKAVRTGIEGLVNRRRATTTGDGEAGGEAKAENKKNSEPAPAAAGETTPATAGRFQGLKDGLDGLKAKRRSAAAAGNNQPGDDGGAGVENEKTKSSAAPDGEGAAAGGGRFKSLKGGLANMKAKKTGTEVPPTKEKVYKEGGPGFIERVRWILVMA